MSRGWKTIQADLKTLANLDWETFLSQFQSDAPGLVLCPLGDSGYTAVNCVAPVGYAFMQNQPLPHRSNGAWQGSGYQQQLEIDKSMTALLKKNKIKKARFGVSFLGLAGFSKFATEWPVGYAGLFEHRAILVQNPQLTSLLEYLDQWLAQLRDVALCPLPADLSASEWHARHYPYPITDIDAFRAGIRSSGRYLFDHRLPYLNANMTCQPGQISLQECQDYLDELQEGLQQELAHLEQQGIPLRLDMGADAKVIPYYYGSGSAFAPAVLLQDLLFLTKAENKSALPLNKAQIVDICRLRALIACCSKALCFFPMMGIACNQLRDSLQAPAINDTFARCDIEDILALCEKYVSERCAQYPALRACSMAEGRA